MGRRWKDTRPLYDTPQAKTVAEAGGVLLYVRLHIPDGKNGGCGAPTYVEGTNGEQMPCGDLLTRFGVTEPYYCGACRA